MVRLVRHRPDGFTILDNHLVKDQALSLKAKGLFALMYSLPDEWDFNIRGLAVICIEGRDAIQGALSELTEKGYLVRQSIKAPNGQYVDCMYHLYGKPCTDYPDTEKSPQRSTISKNSINPNILGVTEAKKPRIAKHMHGTLANVLLTDKELEELQKRFPLDWQDRVESASLYLAAKGDKYKSHFAMLLNWARMDSKRQAQGKPKERRYDHEY